MAVGRSGCASDKIYGTLKARIMSLCLNICLKKRRKADT